MAKDPICMGAVEKDKRIPDRGIYSPAQWYYRSGRTHWEKVRCARCGRMVRCKVRKYQGKYLYVSMPFHQTRGDHFQPKLKQRWDQKRTK